MSLKPYQKKRNFAETSEPKGNISSHHGNLFVVQKHAASHLHYDFRLELNGVLLSWAIPKGPCLDPTVRRLAMHVEDHPVEYGHFEGVIPKGQYGGGTVMLWDKGTWECLNENAQQAFKKGHLNFILHGQKLHGEWNLFRFKDDKHWLLIKHKDEFTQDISTYDITHEKSNSVLSHQSLEEIAAHYTKIWTQHGEVHHSSSKRTKITQKPGLVLPQSLLTKPMPDFIHPQLATLVDKPPTGSQWIHEVKYDGYRILSFLSQNEVSLKSRSNRNWTIQLSPIAVALKTLALNTAIFDGEVVLLDASGKPNFQLLQNSIKAEDVNVPFIYYIFDILYYEGYDLRSLSLLERKTILESLLDKTHPSLLYSEHFIQKGETVFQSACKMALEGIISKDSKEKYISGRSKSWLKVKCVKRQEFVIGGYNPPKSERNLFSSLCLGIFNEEGKLQYTGNVGTGFTLKSQKEIMDALKLTQESPFTCTPAVLAKAIWVLPELLAEIEFTEWTQDGHLRHPSFKGLRLDKQACEVKRETQIPVDNLKSAPVKNTTPPLITLTHPKKILYPEDNISKSDLLHYYETVADYMLPFIKNRPLSLVRCPIDYTKCFFQRHYNKTTPKQLLAISISNKEHQTEEYLYLNDKIGLLSLVQMGVLEIHPWGSQITHLEKPDILIFDLDPAMDVSWKKIVSAAFEVKNHLEQYRLKSFVKTTGGKGLHVVVPILPEYEWEQVKEFSHVFVRFLENLYPDQYISKMNKSKRKGKIFIDYLRNQRGATGIGNYSTRALIQAPVSVPLAWDELSNDQRDISFTIRTLPKRLKTLNRDPWEEFWTSKQSLRLNELDL